MARRAIDFANAQSGRGELQRLYHDRGARHDGHVRGDFCWVGDDGDGIGAGGRPDHHRAFGCAGDDDLLVRHGLGGSGTYRTMSTSNSLSSSTTFTAHTYAPALTVTSMNSVAITGASWSSANNGTVTFTAAANWVLPGTVFTVSGASPSGYNGTYIAGVGTNGTGTTIAAVSWPVATLANPGAYVSGGSFTAKLQSGMLVAGVSGQQTVSPYGTFGSTGTGGTGTYGLTVASNAGFNITASISGTTMNVTARPGQDYLAPGQTPSTAGGVASGTQIVAQTSGTAGGVGNYTVSISQTVASGTLTTTGNLYSSGTPGILYAANALLLHGEAELHRGVARLGGGPRPRNVGRHLDSDRDQERHSGFQNQGSWGGELANVGMHWGVFPQGFERQSVDHGAGLAGAKDDRLSRLRHRQRDHPRSLYRSMIRANGAIPLCDDYRLSRRRERDERRHGDAPRIKLGLRHRWRSRLARRQRSSPRLACRRVRPRLRSIRRRLRSPPHRAPPIP